MDEKGKKRSEIRFNGRFHSMVRSVCNGEGPYEGCYSTISSKNGFVLLERDVFDLQGELPLLAFKLDTRIWLNSPTISVNTGVFTMAFNGGIDVMVPQGELNGGAYTNGSQRPALNF